jgi:hypothetical protein
MNYYFTGVLIIMMLLLAFCGGPATWLINTYIKFLVFLISTLNGLMIYLLQNVNAKERKNESIRKYSSKYAN